MVTNSGLAVEHVIVVLETYLAAGIILGHKYPSPSLTEIYDAFIQGTQARDASR